MSIFDDIGKAVRAMSGTVPAQADAAMGPGLGEGLTPDYLSFRNTYWGQTQPVNYLLLWKAFNADPVVRGAIQLKVDGIVGDGWKLTGGSEGQRKKVQQFLDSNHWSKLMRDLVMQLMIYGDAYTEMVRSSARGAPAPSEGASAEEQKAWVDSVSFTTRKRAYHTVQALQMPLVKSPFGPISYDVEGDIISSHLGGWSGKSVSFSECEKLYSGATQKPGALMGLLPRDPATIKIDYNEHGEVIKYIQRVLHRRVDYFPDEMLHLSMNNVGGRVYGSSGLQSLLMTLMTKHQAELYTWDYFRRAGLPRMVWNLPKYYNKEETNRFKTMLQQIKPNEDIILTGGEDAVATPVAPKNVDMQFTELLDYLRQNILIALQVPPVLAGITESANRSSAQQQMEAFDRHVRSLKYEIAAIFNSQLFTVDNFGFDDVKFSFQEKNSREMLKWTQAAASMTSFVQMGVVTPQEIRDMLGLPPLEDEDAVLEQIASLGNQQSEEHGAGQSGGKKGQGKPGSRNAPRGTNPSANPDKAENAERLNSDQASENKSAHYGTELAYARAAARGMSYQRNEPASRNVEVEDKRREINERHQSFMREESQTDVEEQGSITTRPELYDKRIVNSYGVIAVTPASENGTTNVGGAHRYPFGATPAFAESMERRAPQQVQQRYAEAEEVARNPIGNDFDLNHDRVTPRDGQSLESAVKEGQVPTAAQKKKDKRNVLATQSEAEYDEVDFSGRKVHVGSGKSLTATFYKGTDQLEEP